MAWVHLDILKRPAEIAVTALALATAPIRAQISPGELSRSHEALEGMDNCTTCHERGAEVSRVRCLECHANIRAIVSAKHGMHFRNAGRECAECHKEHLGRDAAITRFSEKTFDHTMTGFALLGRHKPLVCAACHREPRFQTERAALPRTAGRRTYLGLRSECASCHPDRHGSTLGTACAACHSAEGWTPPRTFDHARTRFALAGTHGRVACAKCHEALAATPRPKLLTFSVKSFDDCAPCHSSPHRTGFSRSPCHACHDPSGWKSTKGFDHSATRFPLAGKHASVACAECHTGLRNRRDGKKTDFSTASFRDCSPCHKSPHREELNRSTCSSCHTPAAWRQVDNREFDHGRTRFPLVGKHQSLACRVCHNADQGKPLVDRSRPTGKRCADCHTDVHRGIFTPRYADCAECHQETGFIPSTFTFARHARSRFALSGAHAAIPCAPCHRTKTNAMVFQFSSTACTTCHADAHQGAFDAIMGTAGCETCHSTGSWNRLAFDHGRTGFPLIGRHANVACARCHATKGAKAKYRGTPTACQHCHSDVHAGQFVRGGQTLCANCHTANSWRRLIFDHETQSAFRLSGAHRNVPCGACHRTEVTDDGTLVRFKPLKTTCEGCHQGGK